MTHTRTLVPAALAALALVAAGCGGSKEQSTADKYAAQAEQQATTQPKPEEVKPPVAQKVDPGPGEGDLNAKPKIPQQTGNPPAKLVAQDVIVGTGAEAKNGDKVSVQYVGVLYKNGKEFDSSWKRKQPFEFTIGAGNVIQGWDEGVLGMKVGGRRRLIIPADLAYGAQGQPPTIPPNSALVFDIDLKQVNGQS
ncbi:MAG TPA: FKBP-type peptidyl-prolyl cis-trans isomerase [Solirubrobacteraceae bacterium]|nr:FKBP-type peptidyl-prolyl cis-trans isomerase [Solirubrobacteraceae bacterium]